MTAAMDSTSTASADSSSSRRPMTAHTPVGTPLGSPDLTIIPTSSLTNKGLPPLRRRSSAAGGNAACCTHGPGEHLDLRRAEPLQADEAHQAAEVPNRGLQQ